MGLMQASRTEVFYTCDGCEKRTGDPYFAITKVTADDASSATGWTFFYGTPGEPCTRAYCSDCSAAEAAEGDAR